MSYRMISASVLALMAFGVNAQTADKRVSMEPAHSPFTYEVLGATPSLSLGKSTAPAGEAKVVVAREKSDKTATRPRYNEPAAAENPLGLPRVTKQ